MRQRTYAALKKQDASGQDPIMVAKEVAKIIETERPKLHYPVGRQKSALVLKRILPQSMIENQVRKMFNVDG